MVEEVENPNSIDLLPELLEEVFIRMSVNSILKCRTISKQWRSILESSKFSEKRNKFQKRRKLLAAYDCNCGAFPSLLHESRFEGDEEIVDLHCNATQLSMTCEGLVCFLEQDWIIVLNPSTRQLRRFPSGLNQNRRFGIGLWYSTFNPKNWAMGFGRDKVTGMYKVVRMCFAYRHIGQQNPQVECSILHVQTGEWRKLKPPRGVVSVRTSSTCVNGSIYWLQKLEGKIYMLALDLHKEKFSYVSYAPAQGMQVRLVDTQLVNIEDRLVLATTIRSPEWILKIWTMDTVRKRWRQTQSIRLENRVASWQRQNRWFRPMMVSKQGNLLFCDNEKRLFKYYPKTDEIRCLSLNTCVISPYVENLVPLPLKPTPPHLVDHVNSDSKASISTCRLFSRPDCFVVEFVKRHADFLFVCLVVTGYVCVPL